MGEREREFLCVYERVGERERERERVCVCVCAFARMYNTRSTTNLTFTLVETRLNDVSLNEWEFYQFMAKRKAESLPDSFTRQWPTKSKLESFLVFIIQWKFY